jgi:hypothetical protein
MTRSQALLLLLALARPANAAAEAAAPAELVTDRPDQTESALVVPPGALQVELGASFERDRGGVVESARREAPGALVRFGLANRLELRLAWPGAIESETTTRSGPGRRRETVRGAGDPEVGAKLAWLSTAHGDRLDLAVLGHLTLPVGDPGLGSPRADPSLRLCASLPLGERVGLGWNLGWAAGSEERRGGAPTTLARWIYTAAAGVDLSPRWGAFVELFGDLPASDPEPAAHSFDAGVTFLVSPRLQLDLAAGVGLSEAAPDRFVGFGVSLRVPR